MRIHKAASPRGPPLLAAMPGRRPPGFRNHSAATGRRPSACRIRRGANTPRCCASPAPAYPQAPPRGNPDRCPAPPRRGLRSRRGRFGPAGRTLPAAGSSLRSLPLWSVEFACLIVLRSPRLSQFKCFGCHGWPRHHETVVVARFFRPALPFAERVEAVGEIAGDLRHAADLRLQIRCFLLALLVEAPDQMLGDLPDRQAVNRRGIPVFWKLIPA